MSPATALLLLVLGVTAGASLAEARIAWRRNLAGAVLGLIAIVAAAAVGAALTRPSFLHSNLHGNALVESIAAFPTDPTHRATYGRVSFLVLGASSLPFGHPVEAVAIANHVMLALALAAIGVLVARVTGQRSAGFVAFAGSATFVPLLRVAGSEDAHVTAALFGALALLFADLYGATRRTTALVAWVGAAILMIHSRQTFYLWALFSIGIVRAHGPLRPDRRGFAGAVVVLFALALRVGQTLSDDSERISVAAIPVLLTDPSILGRLLLRHPLLDAHRFALVHLPLAAAGLFVLGRGNARARWLAAALVASFALTLPFGFPVPGVELSFRTPPVLLAAGAVGAGAAAIGTAFGKIAGQRPAAVLLSAVAFATPLLLPGRILLQWQSADFLEYRAVREMAPHLPRRLRLVHPRAREPAPSYHPPLLALREDGIDVVRAHPDPNPDRDTRFVFLLGIRCHGRSLLEDLGITSPSSLDREGFRRVFAALDAPPPKTGAERPECVRAREIGTPIGPSRTISGLPDDPPFVRYGASSVDVQFVAIDPARMAELEGSN